MLYKYYNELPMQAEPDSYTCVRYSDEHGVNLADLLPSKIKMRISCQSVRNIDEASLTGVGLLVFQPVLYGINTGLMDEMADG